MIGPMPAALLLSTSLVMAQPVDHVINGSFDSRARWQLPRDAELVDRASGDRCVLITHGGARQVIWRQPGWATMTAVVDIRAEQVRQEPDGFAYAAVYQYDEAGALVEFRDFVQLREPRGWERYSYTFEVNPATVTIGLHFGFFRASGRAWFDNWTLVEGEVAKMPDETRSRLVPAEAGRSALIWHEQDLELPPGGMPPEWAAEVLREAGIRAELADAAKLSEALSSGRHGLLVLPYGPMYPRQVRGGLIGHCVLGGKLLVVGGYPLNEPLVREGDEWARWRDILAQRRQQALAWPSNLLADGGFEATEDAPIGGREPDGRWHRDGEDCRIVPEAVEGDRAAVVQVRPAEGVTERRWYAWLPVRPGHDYVFTARMRAEGVAGDGYAYAAVYQYRGEELISHRDVRTLTGTTDWEAMRWDFRAEPGSDAIFIKLGLYRCHGRAWFDRVQLVDVTDFTYRPLNTSSGEPRDGLVTSAHQMGMCDADFPLKRAVCIAPSDGQSLLRNIHLQGRIEGWAASGVVGQADARWRPLLDARDRYGRLRGAAGAMLLHYGGFYQGSAWAYFGVTNHRLFGPEVPGSGRDLARLARSLLDGVFLSRVWAEEESYRPGETVPVKASVSTSGDGGFEGRVRITLGEGAAAAARTVTVAGDSQTAEVSLTMPQAPAGALPLTAELLGQEGVIDSARGGVIARDTAATAAGPRLIFESNYFRLNDRPIFLFGSDTYSNTYTSHALNPLRWSEIHAIARDVGLQVYENLQYSNPGHEMTQSDWRAFEGMAQLLQQRGLVFMPGLLIGHNVAVDDEELAAEGRQCFEYTEHLGEVPGLLWYINGDYHLRYDDTEWLREAWNGWLQERYGTKEALQQAWGAGDLPPLGELPFPPRTGSAWDDPVQIDRYRFNLWLMRRWNRHHVAQIRRGDARHAITNEYYSQPFGGIDQRLTIDGQDVANFGFFSTPGDDLRILPERLAFNDMRAVGKGVSMGEYGVKTHPGWSVDNGASGYHIQRTEREQKQLFMSVAAYALGRGASKIQNWCLRDADERVFPWGILYPGRNVPKDVAYVHRNLSMMWRALAPRYDPPAVTVVASDALRIGNHEAAGREAVFSAAQALLRLHMRFNVLNAAEVGALPESTTTVVWPAAIAADEEHFQALLAWVRGGGQLVLTGCPGWSESRRLVAGQRMRDLLGCAVGELAFEGVDREAGSAAAATLPNGDTISLRPQVRVSELPPDDAQVLLSADDGTPLIVRRELGSGTLVWLSDPMELAYEGDMLALAQTYELMFTSLPEPPQRLALSPDDRHVHVMRQSTASGSVWVLYNTMPGGEPREVALETPAGALHLRLQPRWPAVMAVSDDGRLLMALADAPLGLDAVTLIGGEGTVGLLSLDGEDLRTSEAVMVCPFSAYRGRLHLHDGLQAEWGEWADGRWVVLDSEPGFAENRRMIVTRDQATLVALACLPAQRRAWRQHLETLCGRPWRLAGY
ncbi:MAG: beta-galactosidase [Armatimonadota bacterium]